mmetsp:Transcript_8686/g.18766  ORF Transcript_8686/g.18766 Transcript_8686/m.18766 type:complete len:495 (+) Transcript_8686:3321-4805(+)
MNAGTLKQGFRVLLVVAASGNTRTRFATDVAATRRPRHSGGLEQTTTDVYVRQNPGALEKPIHRQIEKGHVRFAASVQSLGDKVVVHLCANELFKELAHIQPLVFHEFLGAESGATVVPFVVFRGEYQELAIISQQIHKGVQKGFLDRVPLGLLAERKRLVPVRCRHDARLVVRIAVVPFHPRRIVSVQQVLSGFFRGKHQVKGLVKEGKISFPHALGGRLDVRRQTRSAVGVIVVSGEGSGLAKDHTDVNVELRPERRGLLRRYGRQCFRLRSQGDQVFVQVHHHAFGTQIVERLRKTSLVDPAKKGHGRGKNGNEKLGQQRNVGVRPSHREQQGQENLRTRRQYRELRRRQEHLSFQHEAVPHQDNVVNVQALKQMRKGEADPGNGLVVRRGPNFDDGIQNSGLHFKGTGRRRRNLQANIGNVAFDGEGHFPHFGHSIQLRQVLPKGHEIRIRRQQDHAFWQKDVEGVRGFSPLVVRVFGPLFSAFDPCGFP